VLIIAAIGPCGGDLDRVIETIEAARTAGANTVKFTAFNPDRLTIDAGGIVFTVQSGPFTGKSLLEFYKSQVMPYAWFPELFKYSKARGLNVAVAALDEQAIEMAEFLDCQIYRIPSLDITDTNLISRAAKAGKHLIISTGMASDDEIDDAVQASLLASKVTLLHCVSAYPAPVEGFSLRRILGIRNRFSKPVGLSDHSVSTVLPAIAVPLGIDVIEKHITLDDDDEQFEMDPAEFAIMVSNARDAREAMRVSVSPQPLHNLRRSIYAVENIQEGERFTHDNVRVIRPGLGMKPNELSRVIGQFASKDIRRGTPMNIEMIR